MACIPLWSSAVRVYDSQAYRKMDITRERMSRILELREMLLSFQAGFNRCPWSFAIAQLRITVKPRKAATPNKSLSHYSVAN